MAKPTKVVTPEGMPNSEHPVVGRLWQITDPTREKCARPWTIQRNREPWTVATNGYIAVFRRGDFGFERAPSPESFETVLQAVGGEPFAFPLAEVRARLRPPPPSVDTSPSCDKCQNIGSIECKACDGDGVTECECIGCSHVHERECDRCRGEGWVRCECGRTPPKETPIVRWAIGHGQFDRELVWAAVEHLPDADATWQQYKAESPARIECCEWSVLVMPLRHEPREPVEYTVPLSPAAALSSVDPVQDGGE